VDAAAFGTVDTAVRNTEPLTMLLDRDSCLSSSSERVHSIGVFFGVC
jgi:hypothetical protein